MQSDLTSQLEILKELEGAIDECDNKLSELTKVDDISEKIQTNLDAKSRASIEWTCSYGAYTSYYLHLLLNEIHPKDHQLSKEIKRLQEFKSKITRAVKGEEEPEKEKEKKKSYKGIKSMLTN